jgi:homogentisate 1,2-dioxygenase
MTFMLESSRSFLFTEYARGGCGTFRKRGTEPRVWDALPVSPSSLSFSLDEALTSSKDRFSSYPNMKEILAQAKADKAAQKARLDAYYDDEKLAELAKSKGASTIGRHVVNDIKVDA